MTARDHNKLLSIFYFVTAGLQLFAAVFIFIMYVGIGGVLMSSSTRQDEQMMGGFFVGMGVLVGLIILAIGAFTLFTAFKVLREQPIGRTLGIIVSILVLLSFPFGTALGIYGLWFFFGEVGKNFYTGLSPGSSMPPAPPSPSSWQ
jgi:glucan phosphoethanolaminetransferase (alkaline phosphatase superfamily)